MSDVGFPATWGTSQAPRRLAATPRSIHSRQSSGLKSACSTWYVTGTPARMEISDIQANSWSRSQRSLATENTRCPALPSASPMAMSSSAAAFVPAASSPSFARCNTVRVVDAPMAPACTASRTMAAISAISCAVAASLARPSPST